LFSNFIEEKTKDDKKNMVFLLVWNEDSYIWRFLVFPCICVLQPRLVHLNHTSSLFPSPLPIVASVTPIQWAYQWHSSFWFPFFVLSLLYFFPLVWPLSNNITAFVLGL
jgi:hypothetical protein